MLFSKKDRQIYKSGLTGRSHDPLAVRRVLATATRGRFNVLCGEAGGTDELKALAAQKLLCDATRAAFDIPAFGSGSAVLDAAVYDELIEFSRWLRGKEPRAKPMPRASSSSGSPAASVSTKLGSP